MPQGRFEKIAMKTGMSDPAWKRTDPNRPSVLCITYPHVRPRRNVIRTNTAVKGV